MFKLIKYVQPIWYYILADKINIPLWVDEQHLTVEQSARLSKPKGYNTAIALQMDMAYQALLKGIIPPAAAIKTPIQSEIVTNIADNYRFIHRFFGKFKGLNVLILRLLSFHNPFIEVWGFLSTLNQKRIDRFLLDADHNTIPDFQSTLLKTHPFVSIIIPTLNRYHYLKDVLTDLQQQTYNHFEVLICDQSDSVDHAFYKNWNLDIHVYEQKEKALWLARNTLINKSNGNYIALTEDDVRLPVDWLENHLKCIEFFEVNISCGIFYPDGKKPVKSQLNFRLSEIFATGNTLLSKDVFKKTGLFDRQFEKQRMGDGEFGLRCILHGEKLVLNPLAYCIDIKAPVGGLREMGSWDALRPQKLFAPRPVPSVLYFIRKYFGNTSAVIYIIKNIPLSFLPYKHRNSKALKVLSFIIVPFTLPIMLWVVFSSWTQASKKLAEGPKIPLLD